MDSKHFSNGAFFNMNYFRTGGSSPANDALLHSFNYTLMIGKWIKRRYTKRVVEDDTKVAAYLQKLNKGSTGPWVAAEGFHIWPIFEFGRGGKPNNIKVGEGVVVKVFFNNQTGEIATALAQAMVKHG